VDAHLTDHGRKTDSPLRTDFRDARGKG
jgi:hypothetical protein